MTKVHPITAGLALLSCVAFVDLHFLPFWLAAPTLVIGIFVGACAWATAAAGWDE